jgi:hypothetical protein
MKRSYILSIPFAFLLHSCIKADPEPKFTLPPITNVGAHTLGFEVDGRVWVNYGQRCLFFMGGCYDNELEVSCRKYEGVRHLNISAAFTVKNKHDERFSLSIDTLRGPGIYQAGKSRLSPLPNSVVPASNALAFTNNASQVNYFSLTPNSTRIVLTKVDTINHQIAGTFEGQLENGFAPGNFVTIRNGRFDVTYSE